jgi:hypothetical protein
MESARRCALCFGFDGDLQRKKGQIAHIDQNSSNADAGNLVYICLEHHDEYDSKTSQVKGITEVELQSYKARLTAAIARGDHLGVSAPQSGAIAKENAIRGHDERLFRQADELLQERFLQEFLNQLQSDDSYWISSASRIDTFRGTFTETGNQFIDTGLSEKLRLLIEGLDALLVFLARTFFVYPEQQHYADDTRLCMFPELNVDRAGPGTAESMRKYDKFQAELDKLSGDVRAAYAQYRLAVKHYLYL